MSLSCTNPGCASPCEFPYLFNNATNGCASAAALLGGAFTAYNLAYAWAAALLLCGFLRSWLFSLREHNWHFVNRPSVLIPLLCTLLQLLAIIEAINLHSLRWSTGIWASLGCDLFVPCTFSALIVHYDHARPRPRAAVTQALAHSSSELHAPKSRARRGFVRRMYNVLGHAVPWAVGLALSVVNATTPTPLAEGASYTYILPFMLVLVADMAKGAWTDRSLRRQVLGLCSMLILVAVYLTVRGTSLLLADGGPSPRPTSATFPLERVPVPVAKVVGSTLALLHYGRPRSDTPACQKSRYVDPLTLIAAHIAILAGLISTGFVVATAESMEAVFLTTVTVVPALFVAGIGAQLLRSGPLLERSDDDTAALIAQCKAVLSRAPSIPTVVKQVCTGSFLVSMSLKMGPARHVANGSSAVFQTLTGLVEVESLFEWMRDRRFDLSIGMMGTYIVLFGTFVLLRLAPMPRWFLATTIASWALFYDVFLISAMRFVMEGLRCAAGNLVINQLVPCDLGYAQRETLWVGFMT
jgi:hypothetical protein